ncbi:hypothetical protein OIDMADRAFT_16866 [Oidiodendron maius Zn]|uniref:Uncharacterized protein n=1 Tax=Oidiodendron maius (strain Zn) TaxID=913774 RepID=A0A0C3HTG9_OIDMZ|nr:hypothetical protein OIDMADRAFT_16866 [Oidiodendron maius Zn]
MTWAAAKTASRSTSHLRIRINILHSTEIKFAPQTLSIGRFENTISHELEGALNYVFLGITAVYQELLYAAGTLNFLLTRVAAVASSIFDHDDDLGGILHCQHVCIRPIPSD